MCVLAINSVCVFFFFIANKSYKVRRASPSNCEFFSSRIARRFAGHFFEKARAMVSFFFSLVARRFASQCIELTRAIVTFFLLALRVVLPDSALRKHEQS